ncbi:MAG TPA: AMP-binding protein, partial [Syntrophales bacterium]|nr:AMP-binding protein [Syntrophales bacterium]
MNIGEWISKRARLYPERPFLREEDGREFNNRTFNRRANRMAHALQQLGLARGDRIAVLMTNSSEFLEIFFACAKTGVIMVPLNFRLAAPELIYIVQDSAPGTLIYNSDFAEKISAIKAAGLPLNRFFRHGG